MNSNFTFILCLPKAKDGFRNYGKAIGCMLTTTNNGLIQQNGSENFIRRQERKS
jgi:hypothetical protein